MSRRDLVRDVAFAGAASAAGLAPRWLAAEPAPEVSTIRIVQIPALCVAPQYPTEELLRAEGFADVRYVPETEAFGSAKPLATGEADVSLVFAGPLVQRVDAGEPVVALAGVMVGCFELFAREGIRTVADLKGKTVAVNAIGGTTQVFVSAIAAYVGVDPRRDIKWLVHPMPEQKRLLAEGRIDALLGFPPTPHELRTRKIRCASTAAAARGRVGQGLAAEADRAGRRLAHRCAAEAGDEGLRRRSCVRRLTACTHPGAAARSNASNCRARRQTRTGRARSPTDSEGRRCPWGECRRPAGLCRPIAVEVEAAGCAF